MSYGTWVQTERKAHESWDLLISKNPLAARLMHRLVAQMNHRSAVVVSQKTLSEMLGVHRNTIGRAVKVLVDDQWIETVKIGGDNGGVKAYVVNRRVAWADKRENQKFASFDARVIVSREEHPENDLPPLRQLPRANEYQMPEGAGLSPPTQPPLEGIVPDLPTVSGDRHLER